MNSRRLQLGYMSIIIPEEGVHHILDNRDVVLWARREQLE